MFGTFFICDITIINVRRIKSVNKVFEILKSEHNRCFLWTPVLFGLGIGIYFSLPYEPSKWLTLGLIEFLLLTAYIFRFYPSVLHFIFLSAIVVAGFADIQLRTLSLEKDLPHPMEGKQYIRGQIVAADTNYRGRPRIILGNMENLRGDKIKGRYRITVLRKNQIVEEGQCVELVAEISKPMTANLPNGYQPDRKLFFDGINGSGYTLSGLFEIECQNQLGFWKRKINLWRSKTVSLIFKQLPSDQAAIAAAIVTGDRNFMTTEQIENYRDSGLAHFLSISGLHMTMIAGLMFFFVRLFMAFIPALALRYNSKKAAAVLAMFISFVYLVVSGAAVPTQRAFVMTFIVLLAVLFERQAISMRVLALSAWIILVVSPQVLVSISFQLSFAAVTALVAFYEKCGKKVERFLAGNNSSFALKLCRGIFAYLVGIIIADLVASLATLPFAIYHFNRIALYTSITNLIAGPIIGFIIMPSVLLALLTLPLGLSGLAFKIAGLGIGQVNALTAWVSSLPSAAVEIYSFPMWGLLLILFGGLWLCLWQMKWRHLGWIFIIIGSFSLLTVKIPDLIAADNGETLAIKNSYGKLQMFSDGNSWMKQNWLAKYASTNAPKDEKISPQQLPEINFEQDIGAEVIKNKITTIRKGIGYRPWNS